MNDLQTLRAVLSPPDPPQHVVDRGRARLQGAMHKPARGRGSVRMAAGLGLTAAAAAAIALVIAQGPAAPARPGRSSSHAGSSPDVTALSGRQILLAAASTAAARPAGSGRFWHVKETQAVMGATSLIDQWYKPDGRSWVLDREGTGVYPEGGCSGPCWRFAGHYTTFRELQRLPTEPSALEAWITRSLEEIPGAGGHPVIGQVAVQLSYLLWSDPIRPGVRAAAFHALALMPNVEHLGAASGGQVLLITGLAPASDPSEATMRLVVDPATAQVRSVTDGNQGTLTILATGWTNRMPPVVRQPPSGVAPEPSPTG